LTQPFDWEKVVTNTWDQHAVDWDERSQRMWEYGSRKKIIPFIQAHVKEGSHVLDVGSGSGYGSLKLHQSGYRVIGVDISEEMIRLANKYRKGDALTFKQGDVCNLSFLDQTFDAIMSINVLEWTKTPVKALSELTRILKQDGLLCVGILGPTAGPRGHSYRRLYGEDVIQNTMMPWEFLQLAKEHHYDLVACEMVWKKEMNQFNPTSLPYQMQQALAFMSVFMLQKK